MYPGPVQESCNWMYTIRDWGTVGLNIVYLLLFIVFFLFKTPVDCSLKKKIEKNQSGSGSDKIFHNFGKTLFSFAA